MKEIEVLKECIAKGHSYRIKDVVLDDPIIPPSPEILQGRPSSSCCCFVICRRCGYEQWLRYSDFTGKELRAMHILEKWII